MKIRTLIVDDEPGSRANLAGIIRDFIPEIQIVAEAGTVQDALQAVNLHKPELVLLDIQLGTETGFDFLQKAPWQDFRIIFITAYSEYALQAFRFAALDYLLKPINVDDLISACQRVQPQSPAANDLMKNLLQNLNRPDVSEQKIALPHLNGFSFIRVGDILRCEADRSYTHIYLLNGEKITVSRNLKEYDSQLGQTQFFRVHASHIINLKCVKEYHRGEAAFLIMTDGAQVPVSRQKKEELLQRLNVR